MNDYDPSPQNLVIATVGFALDRDSALFVVQDATGSPKVTPGGAPFVVSQLTLPSTRVVPFGRSRSSPAFDRQGHLYVASDTDFDGSPRDNDTYPVLFCVDGSTGGTKWVVGLGEESLAYVGASSPVLASGPRGEARVYMASTDNVVSLSEVQAEQGTPACPASSEGLAPCSDHGACNCATGVCACADCWGGGGGPHLRHL